MKRLALFCIALASAAFVLACPHRARAQSLPPHPRAETQARPSAHEKAKARDLFRLAHKENPRLEWDGCLAEKAFRRAKALVDTQTFSHKDPRTGKNPVWQTVVQCRRFRYAGENLAKGYASAGEIHRSLMGSLTHRDNLVSSKHRFLGVGCYDNICVELFAGF
jgi:hypothetical protein